MAYTVKQLSGLAGVSPRTLHYYDEIGLLHPEKIGINKYRYYEEGSMLRLQQILFYRELDLPLKKIKQIMGQSGYDILAALEGHRRAMKKRLDRMERLLQTVEDTIQFLKGERNMSKNQLFTAFSEEQQEEYARQAEQLYDPEIVRASNRKWRAYSQGEKDNILAEGSKIYLDLIHTIPLGAGSSEAQACIVRWRAHMAHFWTPTKDQLLLLAEMYNADPRFKANFDSMDLRLAEFMRDAVSIYVESLKE